jgi:uncharacterized protein YneF (UPF0154 family)
MRKWTAMVSVLLVFVLGILAGALGTYEIYQQQVENIMKDEPRTRSEFIVQRLNDALHLDSTQLDQLRMTKSEGIKNIPLSPASVWPTEFPLLHCWPDAPS